MYRSTCFHSVWGVGVWEPSSSESPGDGIDGDEAEAPRLSLGELLFTLESSVSVAHKDSAPLTKDGTYHVHSSAELTFFEKWDEARKVSPP